MKTVRTAARFLALLLVLTFVLLPFVGCGKKNEAEPATTTAAQGETVQPRLCTVVLETDPLTVYTVDLNKVGTIDRGLISVFEYLKTTEDGFDYEESSGWLSKVGTLENDSSAGKYVYLWTSVEADQSATPFNGPKEYNGVQMIESSKGADQMTIQSGAIYYIGIITYVS